MTSTRVLVVDDEPQIHRILRPALRACGYEVLEAATGREAIQIIAASAPDVVVLDLGLPDMDGKEVLREARAFSSIPIIILSARDRETEKISALDLGADDYVEKPFGIGELLARLRTALRHSGQGASETAIIESAGLCIDFGNHLVTKSGARVKLTPKEFDVLAMLARHAGRLLTHRQILAAVWGQAHQDDAQYLRVVVGKIRSKIEDEASNPKLILTEPGIGYRFAKPEA